MGTALVNISFDDWIEGRVSSSIGTIDLVRAPIPPQREPVSPLLKTTLVHPNRDGNLNDTRWLANGQRIVSMDYPGGTAVVWDVATHRQLHKFDTTLGQGRPTYHLQLTSDQKNLIAPFEKRNITRFEKNETIWWRCQPQGGVRLWDLETGQVQSMLAHSPPRAVYGVVASPDGRWLMSSEMPTGEFEKDLPTRASLWDMRTKKPRELPDRMNNLGVFNWQGTKLAVAESEDRQVFTSRVTINDVTTLQSEVAIPTARSFAREHPAMFSKDDRFLIGGRQVFRDKNVFDQFSYSLVFWDATTGKELGTIPAIDENSMFLMPVASPDGKFLAIATIRAKTNRLLLVDVEKRNVLWELELPPQTTALWPSFSPDGNWIALISRVIPKELEDEEDPELLPQPRIHIINTRTGGLHGTLVGPPGFPNRATFSPNGRYLAVGNRGGVSIYDVGNVIGAKGP